MVVEQVGEHLFSLMLHAHVMVRLVLICTIGKCSHLCVCDCTITMIVQFDSVVYSAVTANRKDVSSDRLDVSRGFASDSSVIISTTLNTTSYVTGSHHAGLLKM